MAPEAEEVQASELTVGDEVWIPNSRKPQAIESISTERDLMRIVAGDASWTLKPEHSVRRVKKVEETEEETG